MPPDAQAHLVNAQRELLLALTLTIQHHVQRMQQAQPDGDDTGRARPQRVELE